MSRPKLTVAMPNYNHAQFLPRAIESIVNQTRPPDEFLILDDASTDDSVSIIQSYADRYPCIRFLQNEHNMGVISAHEQLYRLAQGDYLYSAAADDDRCPTFFEQAMTMAERFPAAGLVFGKMVILDVDGQVVGETGVRSWQSPLYAPPERYLREFLEREPPMQATTGATIFRRAAFQEVGWCRPELGSFADTFAVRAIALKHGACYVPEHFHIWHRLPGGFSHETGRNHRQAIDLIVRAEQLMRGEFADRFPTRYVRRWRRRQKWQIIWNYLLHADQLSSADRPGFWVRNVRRLPRLPEAASLLLYRGDAANDRASG